MRIQVQFFSYLRELTGVAECGLEMPDGSLVNDALAELFARWPRLRSAEPTLLMAIGNEFATRTNLLRESDVLALMPPLQGGADPAPQELLLTNEPIARTETDAGPRDGSTGGMVIFCGVVRGLEEGQPIRALEYTAYREMAEHQFRKLLAETHRRWPLKRIRVVHRLGVIAVGELSLVVRVEAAHRGEAFAAAQFVIDELKRTVPIWKKPVV